MDRKARVWVCILWPDSMDNQKFDNADLIIQYPYEYIVHDKDQTSMGEKKKPHIHLMVCFPSPTTENNILTIMNEFSKDGLKCCNTVFPVKRVKYMHDYMCHDTRLAQDQGKFQYPDEERIARNGFDVSLIQQASIEDRYSMIQELSDHCIALDIQNYADLYLSVLNHFDLGYFEVLISYSGHFERLLKGVWQKNQKPSKTE